MVWRGGLQENFYGREVRSLTGAWKFFKKGGLDKGWKKNREGVVTLKETMIDFLSMK